MFQEFMHHCAVLIQKHVRKWLVRKQYKRKLQAKYKITALVRGYKTRRLILVNKDLVKTIRDT